MNLSITIWLIVLTSVSSFISFSNAARVDRWMFTPYLIKRRNQWDRFVLSGFIHKDFMHLLFNMITFYFFGRVVEQFLIYSLGAFAGGVIFVLFYLLAIIIADIPTYLKHQDNAYYRALGASGGTAATVFASIILVPLSDICLFGIFCLPGFLLGALFLLYSYFKGKKEADGINHDAHLYGALFGILFIVILSPESALNFFDQIKQFRLF